MDLKDTKRSGKIERRRCQHERDAVREVYQEVPPRSRETGNGGEAIVIGVRPTVVPGILNTGVLGKGI